MDVVLNQEESPTLDSGMPAGASFDPNNNTDPLGPSSNDNNNNDTSIPRTTFAGDELDGEFIAAHNYPQLRAFFRYARSIASLAFAIVLDTTSSNNKSLVSKIAKIVSTGFLYAMVFSRGTGMMLALISYLMDHGWYLLAATCSVVLLLLCCGFLVILEWMWAWQGRVISYLGDSSSGYNRLRSVTVLDDDEMEDDLTLMGWIRHIVRALVSCLVWSLYCAINIKVDFWITVDYIPSRPNFFKIVLVLINFLAAVPILVGAALLLYVAYPSFYRWHSLFERLSDYSRGVNNNATNFASSEEIDSEAFTIQVDEDNEISMGDGMQNLII